MKKVIGLMTSIFVTGIAVAQVDTIPPAPNKMDTSMRRTDTMMQEIPKDSSLGKWKGDTTNAHQGMNDSAGQRKWNTQDSAAYPSNGNRQPVADSSYNNNKPVAVDTAKAEKLSDRVMMRDGEMFIIENGDERKLDKEFTFPSGLVVTSDGLVKKKDGTSVKLKDGQYLEIKPMPVKKEKMPAKKAPVKKAPVKKNK